MKNCSVGSVIKIDRVKERYIFQKILSFSKWNPIIVDNSEESGSTNSSAISEEDQEIVSLPNLDSGVWVPTSDKKK